MNLFIRLFFGTATLALLGMFYWSSLIVEERLKVLENKFDSLIEVLHKEPNVIPSTFATFIPASPPVAVALRHLDESVPNLLQEDLFLARTLPQLLAEQAGSVFKPNGVLRMAMLGRPDSLHPFNNFSDVSRLYSFCVPNVAEMHIGKFSTFSPSLALKIEKREPSDPTIGAEYWIHLRDNIFWEPLSQEHFPAAIATHFKKRHPVTAHDFQFFFHAVMNPFVAEPKAASLRAYLGEIVDFEVIDERTFVVRWKGEGEPAKAKFNAFALTASLTPLPCFVYQYGADGNPFIETENPTDYRTSSIWAQNFANHFAKNVIVSCGSMRFEKMNEEGIVLTRNPHFFNPYLTLVEKIQFRFEASTDTSFQDFKANKLDICYLTPSQSTQLDNFLHSSIYKTQTKETEAERGNKIATLDYVDSVYSYVGWNHKSALFGDERVRRAMTLSIDRERLIHQNLNERAVVCTGPFHCYSPSYDGSIEPWPYHPDKAVELLQEAGWRDEDGDGVREKWIGGEKQLLAFSLIYYGKNQVSKSIAEFISSELKKIGVSCRTVGLEITDLSHAFDDKSFDALLMAWRLGSPPEDPKQLWYSAASNEKGSSNVIGFSSKEADSIIEELLYEYDLQKRIALYHRFHRLIHETNPYTFLYFPKTKLAYRERVNNLFIPRQSPLIADATSYEPDIRFVWLTTDTK